MEPVVEPIGETVDEPVVEPAESPIEGPVEEPVDEPVEDPIVSPVEEPVGQPVEEPIEEPVDEPVEEPVVDPVEEFVEEPVGGIIENPAGFPISAQLIINEVMAGTEVNPTKDSWVELFNPTDSEISLSGWQIRGVTAGGAWINFGNLVIPPQGFLLVSYYTSSAYSALAVPPDVQKSSLLFPNPKIKIELKDPEGQIADAATLERGSETDFRSFERINPVGDGAVAESWTRADCQRGIKSSAALTFGSPKSPNCGEPLPEPEAPLTEPPEDEAVGENISNQPPIAVIRIQRGTGGMDLNVTAEDSSDPDGDRLSYQWVFEPGAIDNRENPGVYSFSVPEEKIVTLTVTDEHGASALASIVYAATFPLVVVAKAAPVDPPDMTRSFNKGDVLITSVFPNPVGKDEGQENLMLINKMSERIDLAGWSFENSKGKRVNLASMGIGPNAELEIRGSEIGLSLVNSGDRLALLDPAGNTIDEIEWGECKEGEVVFHASLLEGVAKVVRVVDGDTFHVLIGGRDWVVRLVGVDAPETVHPFMPPQPFGVEASNFLKNRLEGQLVQLESEGNKTDVYGRLLAYATLNGNLVNAELLEGGYARAYLRYPFRLQEEFQRLEAQAKAAKIGLWGLNAASKIEWETVERTKGENEAEEMDVLVPEEAEKIAPPECPTQGLAIDAILPNSVKGESVEFIRLFNASDQTICLDGWKLDDETDGGSKPFAIRGGAIEPGAIRTFRKNETKLSLNNQDDCANLINPLGEVVDRICYGKTHPNEQFTHDGGDWEPTPKKAKKTVKAKNSVPKQKKTPQPYSDYLSSLTTQTLVGTIESIDVEEKTFHFEGRGQTFSVSFAQSSVDMASVAQMMDLGSPMIVDVRNAGGNHELVAIEPIQIDLPIAQCSKRVGVEWELALAFLLLIFFISTIKFLKK